MHLCKEYIRSSTTNTDNTQNIHGKGLLKYSVSASIIGRDSYRVARTSCAFVGRQNGRVVRALDFNAVPRV